MHSQLYHINAPVFIPHHDPSRLPYGSASGQFHPQLPYIYSNSVTGWGIYLCVISNLNQDTLEVQTYSVAAEN